MSQPIEKLAVLFADICGSTALYESLGDDLARKMISRCINTMAGKISVYQGTLIKTIGDEVMVTFPSAEAAFHAACAMLVAVENDQPLDGIPLHIRIGFNYGEVIKAVSYTHLRAHETRHDLVCRLLLEKKKKKNK